MAFINRFWSLQLYRKKEKNNPSQQEHLVEGEFLKLTLEEQFGVEDCE
jgi:hypothetical protein